MKTHALILGLGLLAAAAQSPVQAQDATRGDMVLFPTPAEDIGPNQKGWNMPGSAYRTGSGWWGLACKESCRLVATSLSITKGKHDVYDLKPVPSQLLHWSNLPEDLLVLFKPIRSLAALKLAPGPVVTYLHNAMQSYPRPPSPGTLEVRIPLPNGQYADLVPRVYTSNNTIAAPNRPQGEGSDMDGVRIDIYELRQGARRQRLSLPEAYCQGEAPRPLQYLWWAGDLDGDGKLDLILGSYGGDRVSLYLSSLAKDGELVGEAGGFAFDDPSRGEC